MRSFSLIQSRRAGGEPEAAGAAPELYVIEGGSQRTWPGSEGVDPAAAEDFIRLYYDEHPKLGSAKARIRDVRDAIARRGTYDLTPDELAFGTRAAWRNSSRCIGRLYWKSLRVRDRRSVLTGPAMYAELVKHLRDATNGGKIRPTITVFAPSRPSQPGPQIWNEQLIRYAGYRQPDSTVVGDPQYADFTDLARSLGWPGGPGTPFDVLPLILEPPSQRPMLFTLPNDAVLEVALIHPDYAWFADLALRWHAVPALANMCLEVGGLHFPAAPFNGWYMGTEIGARNLADSYRYNLLPAIGEHLDLKIDSERTLWRDRAIVELNRAVLYSYDLAGVTMADHHAESHRFLMHIDREQKAGRRTPGDWIWLVPPISGAATPVFHRPYDRVKLWPNFVHHKRARALSAGHPPDPIP